MSQLKVFENRDFGRIRVIEIDDQPWWVLKDVCAALGLNSPHKVAERLDEDERNQIPLIDSLGRKQNTAVINESGLYAVILRSDKPTAKDFRRWITSEVLPSIRKHGAYITEETLNKMLSSHEFTEALLDALAEEHSKYEALAHYVRELEPKAEYFDLVLQCKDAIQVSIIAKDYGMSAVMFNHLLFALGIQFNKNKTWVLYEPYENKGYTVTHTFPTPCNTTVIHTYWTQKGRLFLYEKLRTFGILPNANRG